MAHIWNTRSVNKMTRVSIDHFGQHWTEKQGKSKRSDFNKTFCQQQQKEGIEEIEKTRTSVLQTHTHKHAYTHIVMHMAIYPHSFLSANM